MPFATVTGKFLNMRKEQEFTVCPKGENQALIQSDKSIGLLDLTTGKGMLNTKGKYFAHLNKVFGAVDFDFPQEFVNNVKAGLGKMNIVEENGSKLVRLF